MIFWIDASLVILTGSKMGKIAAFGGILWLSGMACGAGSAGHNDATMLIIIGAVLGIMAIRMYRADLHNLED